MTFTQFIGIVFILKALGILTWCLWPTKQFPPKAKTVIHRRGQFRDA